MKTVLIVDDTEDYARNLKYILDAEGYNTVLASSGREGVEKAVLIIPDLILMDIMMPNEDGVETTIKIREQASLKDVPVVFLTSITAGDDVVTSVKGKDFPTISKMIDHEKLLIKIEDILKVNKT